MFEDKTRDNIHDELLANIDDSYDKTQGYPIWDILRSFAIEGEKIYQNMNLLAEKVDVDKLTGSELERFVSQRKGITRKQATKAKGQLMINGNGTINIGDLFETPSGIQFRAIETKTILNTGVVNIEALVAGDVGNVPANQIIQMPVTLSGITSVNNTGATHDGYEAETDTSLRERYYLALKTPATSGNKWHYLQWAKEIAGVGDAKVFPLERGDNTVEIVIIDSNKQPTSESLIEAVQNYIDPGSLGKGEGAAPIGAYCYAISAIEKPINISLSVTLLSGYGLEEVQTNIENAVDGYLKEIAFKRDFISYAKLGSVILDSEGVEDYSDLVVNGQSDNIPIGVKEVAILGGVTIV
ncbi:putative phage protein gp47/JayE [Anaerosolibacter carboniphilus]|uniref:Putative phage protein gp47/JayE n=1 Tax=Anaerosolibacter carboniphilus TaxID=1417629 RepID=A0A841KVJ9_9FIRM|nr:baseplate J/gp47 family protein [Anaerosolibacter carboniphilus]MBB6214952.1 putative phage protein gp47/JayE [Anaerosolibacter carboniphilus]